MNILVCFQTNECKQYYQNNISKLIKNKIITIEYIDIEDIKNMKNKSMKLDIKEYNAVHIIEPFLFFKDNYLYYEHILFGNQFFSCHYYESNSSNNIKTIDNYILDKKERYHESLQSISHLYYKNSFEYHISFPEHMYPFSIEEYINYYRGSKLNKFPKQNKHEMIQKIDLVNVNVKVMQNEGNNEEENSEKIILSDIDFQSGLLFDSEDNIPYGIASKNKYGNVIFDILPESNEMIVYYYAHSSITAF